MANALENATFYVSRDRLDLDPLDLNSGSGITGLRVVEWGPGERRVEVAPATSSLSDGHLALSARADVQDATIVIRVWGSPVEIFQQFETLERAFHQLEYTLTVALDDEDETEIEQWKAMPASSARGNRGVYHADQLAAQWEEIEFRVPIQPRLYKL